MPTVLDRPAPSASIAGTWTTQPLGVILHGSRSGQVWSIAKEFDATVSWAVQGAPYTNTDGSIDYLGWNASIGEDVVANHIDCYRWGWSAREASHQYLAVEFAQAHQGNAITDPMVDAFVWWFLNVARGAWPSLPAEFPTHAELPAGIRDGKTDVFINGDMLRTRINAQLKGR